MAGMWIKKNLFSQLIPLIALTLGGGLIFIYCGMGPLPPTPVPTPLIRGTSLFKL